MMARWPRHEVYGRLFDARVLPLFYHPDAQTSGDIIRALGRGGAPAVEYTNRGDGAYEVFAAAARELAAAGAEVVLGVGSVVDAPTAALFIAAGAGFVVGPSFNPEIARLCNRRKVAYIPGCMTPTEIATAEEAGCELIKVFPGNVVTPEFIRAVLAPSPWSRLMPSGGVDLTAASVGEWISAGAAVIGMGSKLVAKDVVQGQHWDRLSEAMATCIEWVRQARR
jgi:2-dehydro-3-deoxyphosphogluconate aldolase/(4S)-4-hydroxy-2-oxoglutarate aldolase